MITLIRYIRLKQLEIKWKLAIMHELDKQLMTLIKNPEMIEKKLLPFIAEVVHKSTELEKAKMMNDKFGEK